MWCEECWGTLEWLGFGGVVGVVIYNILYIDIGGCGVLGGGDGSATSSEQMAAVLEFGNNPPCK